MKKVLFLMVLLLLMGLGAASVKAQVRIGGNTAPSAAAVLDLNATDAANLAKGGLVLPRVDLTSNTMQLTTGVANVTGTMVYNVTTTLGRIGIFYWNGNSWVLASLPSATAVDSGKSLYVNSQGTIVVGTPPRIIGTVVGTVSAPGPPSIAIRDISFTMITCAAGHTVVLPVNAALPAGHCFVASGDAHATVSPYNTNLYITSTLNVTSSGLWGVRCLSY